ncbi:fibronectin type III domain-containing protein [Micromonospora echinaurantiaca]|uniref:fibronectin type III domain-containing protein n=1 Tax=Micromonospora echinaurantiaca TaxID=47857 RepID=UPI0037928D0F
MSGPPHAAYPAPPVSAPPAHPRPVGGTPLPPPPVSAPPQPPYPPRPQPVSAPPGHPHQVSGPPVAPPPVSAPPVPPWGMTAPPWGSMTPPQPLAAPVDDSDSDSDDSDDADADEEDDTPAYVDLDLDQPRLEPAPEPTPARDPARDAPSAFPQQPAYPSTLPAYSVEEPESGGRSRTTVVVAVVAAVAAVAAVAGVGALVLGRDAAPPAEPAPSASASVAATTAGPPPTDLKLRDDTATITLTWTDPSDGAVPFMVAGGRTGQALGVMASVDPGQTTYTVNGLNSRVDYCFTVLAVYSTDSFATSGQVCTEREGGASPR